MQWSLPLGPSGDGGMPTAAPSQAHAATMAAAATAKSALAVPIEPPNDGVSLILPRQPCQAAAKSGSGRCPGNSAGGAWVAVVANRDAVDRPHHRTARKGF